MKKIVKSLVLAFLLINLGLTAFAATDPILYDLNQVAKPTTVTTEDENASAIGLPSMEIGQHPDSPTDYQYSGVGVIGSTAYFMLDLFKFLMSGIAVLVIIALGVRMIVKGDNDDETGKIKKGMGMAVGGLILIQFADIIVRKIFFGDQGEVLEDKTSAQSFATAGTEQIRGIIGFIQLALGGIAMLMIVINGIKIMIGGSEEDTRKKGIKNIAVAAVGLIIVLISELVVKGFIFPDQGDSLPSTEVGKGILIMATNFISGFLAVIAFVMLLTAGYMYVVAGSDETTKEKVKKLILGAVIGLIIALGAYAMANTLITFREPNEYPEQTSQN